MLKHEERLAPLGIKPQDYTFEYYHNADYAEAEPHPHAVENPMTTAYLQMDKHGNVEITYPSIYGAGIMTYFDGKKNTYFVRTRLSEPKGDMKYLQPKGTGVNIFYPRNTLKKIREKTKIETLYLVEGEFKSIYGDHFGLDMVGIGGIQNFRFAKGVKEFHPDITRIIKECKVENIVLLADADIFHLKWNPDRDKLKDLGTRLFAFYSACLNFKDCAAELGIDAYFMHIREEYCESAKGLDDLFVLKGGILNKTGSGSAIVEDILKQKKASEFFAGHNLAERAALDLRDIFMLPKKRATPPEQFYTHHKNTLDRHEFTFNGVIWKHEDGVGLKMLKHKDADSFARVGDKYVKIVYVPNSKGYETRQLVPFLKGEIKEEYCIEKGIKSFISMIPKYDAFVNIPENDPTKYELRIKNCFNMYHRVEHAPVPGEWPTTEKYLKHLFQNQYQDKMDLMLDWLQLLYLQPTQLLPIPVLASKEKNTGKSTFIFWLTDIFKENAAVIGNDELMDKWNDDYVSKLVVGIDEGFIDKRHVIEKIKSWSTAPWINLSAKFASRQKIDNNMHMVITTNDETDFIKIDSDETRFLMCKVPVLSKEDLDPDLRLKMQSEVPHFLYFLKTRKLKYERKTRHFFAVDALETDALRKLKAFSKTALEKEIEMLMMDKFRTFQESPICMSLKDLVSELNEDNTKGKYDRPYIQKTLEEKMEPAIPYVARGRYRYLRLAERRDEVSGHSRIVGYDKVEDKKQNKYYKFYAERFLTEEQIAEWKIKNVEGDDWNEEESWVGLGESVERKSEADELPF